MSLDVDTSQLARRRRKKRRRGQGNRRARDVIDFIERLTIPSGIGAGQRFELMEWQKRFIRDIYSPQQNGKRIVRRAILSISRKNGKTALISAIVLAHLVGPEAIPRGEIYSAANDRDQAAIVFKFVRQLIEQEPELRGEVEIIPSTKTMIAHRTGSIYRALSSEVGTKHGYLPSVVIYDELAQSKSRALYDVLDTSFGSRSEPLFIAISTQSNDPEHILSKLIDDGLSKVDPSIVCHLYAADEGCALDDESQWTKANPALDIFRDRQDLVSAIKKAIRLPSEEAKVRNLFLNQRVSPITPLIAAAEWKACAGEVEFEPGERVYLALDLSSTQDLTALVMGSIGEPCRITSFFWKPGATVDDHSARDFGTGSRRYREWMDSGHLLLSAGRSISHEQVALKIADLSRHYQILGMAYDRWRINDLLREFDRIGFAAYEDGKDKNQVGLRLVPWGQGFKDQAPAIDALENAINSRALIHDSNPVLNWNMTNAIAVMDPAGGRKLDKSKARFRIDGAAALAMLMGLRSRDRGPARIVDVEALIG
jgi:phage terminase large subunit-like protein